MQDAASINFSISQEQGSEIEKCTRNQDDHNIWFVQKAGRITAAKFKLVYKTSKTKPSMSLIKAVCYPVKMQFQIKATGWGLNEKNCWSKAPKPSSIRTYFI